MGLGPTAVEAIAREHAFRPITGDVLFIGRQATYLTPDQLMSYLSGHGHAADRSAIEIDRTTVNRIPGSPPEIVTDRSIFRALGIDSIKALDVSRYEGAEVEHDLNRPLPDSLKGTADFIVDGSTLDNVFDPAMALRNFAELLRPGGRLIAINAYNVRESAYTICTPLWFLDYFVENGFVDCKVYVVSAHGPRSNVYWLDTKAIAQAQPRGSCAFPSMWWPNFLVVFAEKGGTSATPRTPVQQSYRTAGNWSDYVAKLAVINRSERPHLVRSGKILFPRLARRWYVLIDKDFQSRALRPSLPRHVARAWYRWRTTAVKA